LNFHSDYQRSNNTGQGYAQGQVQGQRNGPYYQQQQYHCRMNAGQRSNICAFRTIQCELFALPVCSNPFGSQATYNIFYVENIISNYASYTVHNNLHDKYSMLRQQDQLDQVPSSLLIAATMR
jgi:hypothetical protein